MRGRIDIAKYRSQPLPCECMRGGRESERRHDHFSRQVKRANRKLEADRRICYRDAVRHTKILADLRFELLHEWAVVCEPISIERALKPCAKFLWISHIWVTNMQWN